MSMQYLEREFRKQGKGNLADIIASVYRLNGSDIPLPSAPAPALDAAVAVEKPAPQNLSKDQLILPEAKLPQEVSDILQRAEKAGMKSLEAYHFSGVALTKNTKVDVWEKKPEEWYWEQIQNGHVDNDAATLPDSWVLIDKTQKPDHRDGKQMYKNDPLGALLQQLRKDKKIQTIKGIPVTSRFGISHDELTQVVLPEIAKLLGVDASQVRLPKAIEFNVIGNLKHPEWGETDTWEWFEDKFEGSSRLLGGRFDDGGLGVVNVDWSDDRGGDVGFRPLVVVPTKA